MAGIQKCHFKPPLLVMMLLTLCSMKKAKQGVVQILRYMTYDDSYPETSTFSQISQDVFWSVCLSNY